MSAHFDGSLFHVGVCWSQLSASRAVAHMGQKPRSNTPAKSLVGKQPIHQTKGCACGSYASRQFGSRIADIDMNDARAIAITAEDVAELAASMAARTGVVRAARRSFRHLIARMTFVVLRDNGYRLRRCVWFSCTGVFHRMLSRSGGLKLVAFCNRHGTSGQVPLNQARAFSKTPA